MPERRANAVPKPFCRVCIRREAAEPKNGTGGATGGLWYPTPYPPSNEVCNPVVYGGETAQNRVWRGAGQRG